MILCDPPLSGALSWSGLDITIDAMVQEFWRHPRGFHINVTDLEAAIDTVQSLAQPKEHVRSNLTIL